MKYRVLISAPYLQPVIGTYRNVFEKHGIDVIVPKVKERLGEEELFPLVQDIDGVICGDDRFTESVLNSAKKLKIIVKWGTGIDSIDVEAARRCGIHVCNTPGAFTDAAADTVLGYMLMFARQLPRMDQDIRSGKWEKRLCRSLKECVLGVVGVGNVGSAVIQRAVAFGMRVVGNDLVEIPSPFLNSTALDMLSLDDLLSSSDFVSLNCTLNPTSFHLINADKLKLMKPTAYLINTARGPIVHEEALVRALQNCQIAGAAMDVFEDEPLPADSPLRVLDNCWLAPHNANSSPTAWNRVHENSIRQLLEGLNSNGRP